MTSGCASIPLLEPGGAALVWLHGGAFMFGTLEMPEADQVGRRLSAAGVTVISVDYTLAPLDALEVLAPPDPDANFPSPEQLRAEAEAAGPRARFPVASLQIVDAFDWAVQNARGYGADPERVALGGASAGANLSAGAAMRLRDRGTTLPSLLALVYPSLHDGILEPNDELKRLLEGVPPFRIFTPEARDAINRNYLPDRQTTRTGMHFPAATISPGFPRCSWSTPNWTVCVRRGRPSPASSLPPASMCRSCVRAERCTGISTRSDIPPQSSPCGSSSDAVSAR